jgi:hypothetical protein
LDRFSFKQERKELKKIPPFVSVENFTKPWHIPYLNWGKYTSYFKEGKVAGNSCNCCQKFDKKDAKKAFSKHSRAFGKKEISLEMV